LLARSVLGAVMTPVSACAAQSPRCDSGEVTTRQAAAVSTVLVLNIEVVLNTWGGARFQSGGPNRGEDGAWPPA
jgi:hypothetical protein